MKKFLMLILIIPLLAACTVSISVGNPWDNSNVKTVDVQLAGDPTARDTASIAPGSPLYIKVAVPQGISQDLVVVEANANNQANLTITVHSSASESAAQYRSTSASFFTSANSSATSSVSPQAIVPTPICLGPCIVMLNDASQSDTVYVKVTTDSSTSVDFFAYATPFGDQEEPGNNSCDNIDSAAIVITPDPQGFVGAIETLGDHDCYSSAGAVSTFTLRVPNSNTSVPMQADVYSVATRQKLGTVTVNSNETKDIVINPPTAIDIDIYSSNGRAAPASKSNYVLLF